MALNKIVNLHASWCGPCKQFEPVFTEVSKDEKYNGIMFERFDIESDESTEWVEKFKVRAVPTTLLIDENGEEIVKLSGSMNEASLRTVIDRYV